MIFLKEIVLYGSFKKERTNLKKKPKNQKEGIKTIGINKSN